MEILGGDVLIGHWSDHDALTGCTVVLFPEVNTASGEVRGGAPATREFALLDPTKTVSSIDAVVLTGGSAFGLAACDGVMKWLEANERGFETKFGRVPIVIGLGLFDLGVGDSSVRPGPVEGQLACDAATPNPEHGPVGAGTGCTIAKWGGEPTASGLGIATVHADGYWVTAVIAVNAYGFLSGEVDGDPGAPQQLEVDDRANTTIGVVFTNAALDKVGCRLLAESAHGGLSRSLYPAHTAADGDAIVAVSVGAAEAHPFHVRLLAQLAVEQAVGISTRT